MAAKIFQSIDDKESTLLHSKKLRICDSIESRLHNECTVDLDKDATCSGFNLQGSHQDTTCTRHVSSMDGF